MERASSDVKTLHLTSGFCQRCRVFVIDKSCCQRLIRDKARMRKLCARACMVDTVWGTDYTRCVPPYSKDVQILSCLNCILLVWMCGPEQTPWGCLCTHMPLSDFSKQTVHAWMCAGCNVSVLICNLCVCVWQWTAAAAVPMAKSIH